MFGAAGRIANTTSGGTPAKWYDTSFASTLLDRDGLVTIASDGGVNLVTGGKGILNPGDAAFSNDYGVSWSQTVPNSRSGSPTEELTGLASGAADEFVAVGTFNSADDCLISLTTNAASSWTEKNNAFNTGGANISSVIWDGSQYVALGIDNSSCRIQSSPSGTTWSNETAPVGFSDTYRLEYLNGYYFVSGVISGSYRVYRSTDLTTWTRITDLNQSSAVNRFLGFAYSSSLGLYVAIGREIWTASDPTSTWTQRTGPHTYPTYRDIVWHPRTSTFVAVGQEADVDVPSTTTTDPVIITSSDGITWTDQTDIPTHTEDFFSLHEITIHGDDELYVCGYEQNGFTYTPRVWTTRFVA